MFEFLNTVAKEYPELAIGLALILSFGFLLYYIIKDNKEERRRLQETISRQHSEAINQQRENAKTVDKNTEAFVQTTGILSELKGMIQTYNHRK
jgi:hypothetical protein